MSIDGKNIIALAAKLGAGMLAGILVGTGLAAFTAKGLTEAFCVMRFQLEDRLIARAMPPLMPTTLMALIAACALARVRSHSLSAASVLFVVLVLMLASTFEVPLNKEIPHRSPVAAPSNSEQIRDI